MVNNMSNASFKGLNKSRIQLFVNNSSKMRLFSFVFVNTDSKKEPIPDFTYDAHVGVTNFEHHVKLVPEILQIRRSSSP